MAFSAVAALVAGEAVTTTLVLSAMAEIGTAMTIVGAATGSKSLMKVGGVIGLVGGVGGMINGAMSGAATAATDGLTEAGTQTALDTASDQALNAYGGEAGASAATDGVVQGMEGAQGMTQGSVDGVLNNAGGTPNFSDIVTEAEKSLGEQVADLTKGPADLTETPDYLKKMGGPQDAGDSILKQTQTASATSGAPSATDIAASKTYTPWEDGFQPSSVTPGAANVTDPNSVFAKIMGWAKTNPTLANGFMQLGGGLLKGMGEASMVDKKLAQNQQQFNTLYGHANEVASYRPMGIVQSARA